MSPPIRAGRTKLENVFQIRTPCGVLCRQISHESSGKSRLTRRKVYRYLGTYTPPHSISPLEFRSGTRDKKHGTMPIKKNTKRRPKDNTANQYSTESFEKTAARTTTGQALFGRLSIKRLILQRTVSIYTTFHEKNPGGLNIPTIIFTFVNY